jgi:hypothetical protein
VLWALYGSESLDEVEELISIPMGTEGRLGSAPPSGPNGAWHALNNAATVALMAAVAEGKDLVDDACARGAVAELTRE